VSSRTPHLNQDALHVLNLLLGAGEGAELLVSKKKKKKRKGERKN
jgi:hypothetical protein